MMPGRSPPRDAGTGRDQDNSCDDKTRGRSLMSLTLKQVRDNCQSARASMRRARNEHWAFGAFNLDDEQTLMAIAWAPQRKRAPVLAELS